MCRPYEHRIYRAGLNVYIDPAIRELHPESPLAGQVVRTCEGIIYQHLEALEDQSKLVPVLLGEQMWYAEEEYVQID